MTKKKPGAKRGRPPGPIADDPDRFKLAAWRAFYAEGFDKFESARLALLVTDPEGGRITIEVIEGFYRKATATIPLPQPVDTDDLDKGLRQLSTKVARTKSTPWLPYNPGMFQGLIRVAQTDNNLTGIRLAYDRLSKVGWDPLIIGLTEQIASFCRNNSAATKALKSATLLVNTRWCSYRDMMPDGR